VTSVIMDYAPPNASNQQIELRDSGSGVQQLEANPRQHEKITPMAKNELRCDAE
jgi:hypothetical protein